ncbi:WecB/TagA/CpsF family glycosyltransferase [Rhodosalinus sp. 5P4]|uniref:WecB/TagA/CpsF family glycosyltransferase n=1 Tax=Rhodosalinus sp. 5P4 TaxID=3239196 RepID=UPI003524D946
MMKHSLRRDTALLEAVTVPSQAALLEDLRDRIAREEGFAVATMNLDHAVKLRQDSSFRQAYAAQTHVTADGRPIVWLSRLAGRPVSLVTGSDLVGPLIELCAKLGAPVALLGSTPEALREAAERLRAHHPGLQIAALLSPAMGFDPSGAAAEGLIEDLQQSEARVCLLALGAPKQEMFAARALQALPCIGFVSVGAGLDFVAGTQKRAPRLVRRFALEWMWRLSGNPRRLFRRYASCAAILPALTWSALSMRVDNAVKRE